MLQQQLHAFQASSCTGIAQRSAAVNVACIHLEDREPRLRQKKTYLSRHHDELVTQTSAYLSTSIQQQSDTLGLSLYTRLVEGGDGVDGHDVHCCACLDQLLQLEGPALCRRLVHC